MSAIGPKTGIRSHSLNSTATGFVSLLVSRISRGVTASPSTNVDCVNTTSHFGRK
jgi:hypothetical protein